jgi:hypothetical protein
MYWFETFRCLSAQYNHNSNIIIYLPSIIGLSSLPIWSQYLGQRISIYRFLVYSKNFIVISFIEFEEIRGAMISISLTNTIIILGAITIFSNITGGSSTVRRSGLLVQTVLGNHPVLNSSWGNILRIHLEGDPTSRR